MKSLHYLPVLVAEGAEELVPEHGRDEGQEVLVGLELGFKLISRSNFSYKMKFL